MIYTFSVLAILIGALMPFQAGINAKLTHLLHHPFLAAFLSLLVGALLLFFIALIQGAFQSSFQGDSSLLRGISELRRLPQVPIYYYLGGVLGALFVTSSLFLIPKMGATALIASFITGQLIGSLLIDHFGLLGLPIKTIQWSKILGVIFLFLGVFLVMRKNS